MHSTADTTALNFGNGPAWRVMPGVRLLTLEVTAMNEKRKERWGRVRAKGRARYIFSNIIASVLCVVIGHALWRLTEYVWRGDSTPPFRA